MAEVSNLEIVQKGYDCFAKGDIPGLLSLFSENITWTLPEVENAPFAGSREGLASVGEFFSQLDAAEDITRFEPLEFIAQDDKVVVLGESAATVKSTSRSYETDWVHIFHLKDGKISSFHEFFDNAAATKAFQRTSGTGA